jgi:hypothetical protein
MEDSQKSPSKKNGGKRKRTSPKPQSQLPARQTPPPPTRPAERVTQAYDTTQMSRNPSSRPTREESHADWPVNNERYSLSISQSQSSNPWSPTLPPRSQQQTTISTSLLSTSLSRQQEEEEQQYGSYQNNLSLLKPSTNSFGLLSNPNQWPQSSTSLSQTLPQLSLG